MLCGYLPFSEEDDEKNNKLIISGKVDYPKEIGNVCKDLLKKMLEVNPQKRYNFLKISRHPWVKSSKDTKIIGGYNFYETIYPVDERLLKIIQEYGIDPKKVENELKLNKFNSNTGLFKLISKKALELKLGSISDFTTNGFIEYMKDNKNAKEDGEKKYSEFIENLEESTNKFRKIIFEYKSKENNIINKLEEWKALNEEEDINKNENKEILVNQKIPKSIEDNQEGNEVLKREENKNSSIFNY